MVADAAAFAAASLILMIFIFHITPATPLSCRPSITSFISLYAMILAADAATLSFAAIIAAATLSPACYAMPLSLSLCYCLIRRFIGCRH